MCLAQGPQRSDAGEARTRSPSVSSQALHHWATALHPKNCHDIQYLDILSSFENSADPDLPSLFYNGGTSKDRVSWAVAQMLLTR